LGVTTFFGTPNDVAVAAAIVTHAISYVPVVLTGILFLAQDGLSLGRLQSMAPFDVAQGVPGVAEERHQGGA
jgi:hypothetical protein